jgi:hypothetical protein
MGDRKTTLQRLRKRQKLKKKSEALWGLLIVRKSKTCAEVP